MIGQVVGNYQIVDKLSEGGMGAVYRAMHSMIGKRAAVKVLLPEFSSNREMVQRFFNEARAATSIRHPGIVEIYDFGYHADGRAYIVMELLDGEPLSNRLARRGRLSEGEAAALIRQVAGALGAAHGAGVVHRDLKPDNIFVIPDPDMPGGERTKLLDFGIAKLNDQGPGHQSKTRTGAVMGTPTYMSPEQCRGSGDIDHRSDLYSLGCILYQLLTGRPPFVAEGAGEIIGAHLHLAPSSPRPYAPELSLGMEQLVMSLLAKDPAHRIQSAAELAQHLGGGGGASAQHPAVSAPPAMYTPVSYTPSPAYAAAAPAPTTLGGAAAQATHPTTSVRKRGRTGLVVGIAVVLVAAGVVVATQVGKGGKKSDETVAVADEAKDPPPVEAKDPPPVEAKDPPPVEAKDPPPVEAPAKVHVTLEVTPATAQIAVGGKPLDGRIVELAADASAQPIEVTAPGHKPQTLQIGPDGGDRTIKVALEATAKKPPRHGKKKIGSGSATTGSPIEDDL